jgi:SAM-dependent methyltransferase
MSNPDDDLAPPSPWVVRFAPLIASDRTVLDLAAGGGRHTRYFLGRGHPVVAVDRNVSGLSPAPGLETIRADLEAGPWPLADRRFGGIVVTNYLHRPLLPILADSLLPGGVLIYETFAVGQEAYGRPSNPDFLLRPNELIEAFGASLTILAFEHSLIDRERPAIIQRIAARRENT